MNDQTAIQKIGAALAELEDVMRDIDTPEHIKIWSVGVFMERMASVLRSDTAHD
jgi:hypothetical protein